MSGAPESKVAFRPLMAAALVVAAVGVGLLLAFVGITGLLLRGDLQEAHEVAGRLSIFIVLALVLVEGYLVFRLWPVCNTLRKMKSDEGAAYTERRRAAGNALLLPLGFLSGSVLVTIGVGLLLGAGFLAGLWPMNIAARQVLAMQTALLLFGGVTYLATRRIMRPVLERLEVPDSPISRRFGMRLRVTVWTVMLTMAALIPVLILDTHASRELADQIVWPQTGIEPLLAGPRMAAVFLILLFGTAAGLMFGHEIASTAENLRRRLDRILPVAERAAIDRLPVHSMTDLGRIAAAFNRLAGRLEAQHKRLISDAEQVKKAEAMRSRFLANVSHELRTPLNSIIGYSDLMLRGFEGDLSDRQNEEVKVINSEGEKLLYLINDILLMARFEAGKSVLQLEKVVFAELLSDAYRSAGPALDTRVPKELESAELLLDRSKVGRAMQALVNYTLRAEGHDAPLLTARQDEEGTLFVRLLRQGHELPSEQQRSLFFEGFRKTGESPGLGLPLAKRVAELHGGNLRFVAEEQAAGLEIELPPRPCTKTA